MIRFLDKVLSEPIDATKLQEMWWALPTDIVFPDDQNLIDFLRLIREELSRVEQAE